MTHGEFLYIIIGKEVAVKKVIVLSLLIITFVFADQRVVVAEQFTATWCTYCPGASRAHDELYHRAYDSVVVIAYHPSTSDPFYSTEAVQRANYYSIPGYPTSWFDGSVQAVGGQHYGTVYPWYRGIIDNRLAQGTAILMFLECTYDTVSRTGVVTATVENTAASARNGALHFAVVENDISFSWQGMSKLDFLMRDMLPDANGEAVSIPAGDTIIRDRSFSLDALWAEENCKIVVFLQSATREIYQGAETAIMQEPWMEYYGMSVSETAGNGNGIPEPGESVELRIAAKNLNNGSYTGSVTVQVTDPQIAIQSTTPQACSIAAGEVDTVVHVNADIAIGCPDPHETAFEIDFGGLVDTIPFVIASRAGFNDNMESGEGDWSHSGQYSNWHLDTTRYNSPTHSWYCGNISGNYTNMNDASLYSPYFVATPDSDFSFYHWHATEPNSDYGYVEVDNGSGWWKTLGDFTGSGGSWMQEMYPMAGYGGQTIRLRFRFISDYSIFGEGWYIDDVLYPSNLGIQEDNEYADGSAATTLGVFPSVFSQTLDITYRVGSKQYGESSIRIRDITGRLVKQWSYSTIQQANHIVWDGRDDQNRILPAGVYFVVLETGSDEIMEKTILVR
ncbi:hypothetical protein AMJ87_12570 [candidate division WOR_3 bacterium SM23_60]|uniref:Omp28-related outer membrane protein n=1 Tax=candidate division WOR_3 bacterium SM23_60 TaxID=1703780 RepID=A0A0S8G787_UNCW3|nr:MAG: hypothetical protein AMJ87_12570 [candidate division WOR_3 bacterium SM23_60]